MDMYGLHEALNQANQLTHNEVEANMDIQDDNNKILSGVAGEQMKNDALNDVMEVKNAGLLGVSGMTISSAYGKVKEARELALKVKGRADKLKELSKNMGSLGSSITSSIENNKSPSNIPSLVGPVDVPKPPPIKIKPPSIPQIEGAPVKSVQIEGAPSVVQPAPTQIEGPTPKSVGAVDLAEQSNFEPNIAGDVYSKGNVVKAEESMADFYSKAKPSITADDPDEIGSLYKQASEPPPIPQYSLGPPPVPSTPPPADLRTSLQKQDFAQADAVGSIDKDGNNVVNNVVRPPMYDPTLPGQPETFLAPTTAENIKNRLDAVMERGPAVFGPAEKPVPLTTQSLLDADDKNDEVRPAEPPEPPSEQLSTTALEDTKAKTFAGKIGEYAGISGKLADTIGKGAGTLASVGLLTDSLEGQYKSFTNPNHHGFMQDLSGDNTAEKLGNLGSEIGSVMDIVGTATAQPELALIGSGISAVGGLASDIGSWFEHKDDDKKIQDNAVASESNLRVVQNVAQSGDIAEGSKSTLRMEGQ